MHLEKRLISVAAVLAMVAAVLWGGFYGNASMAGSEEEMPLIWGEGKETIHFWYTDEAMTNFVNSAAVAFGEREDARVLPALVSESEYLEAISRASAGSGQVPDAYLIGHDSLEKAYLAGLATPIQDVEGICTEESFPAAALSAVCWLGWRRKAVSGV